MLLQSSINYTVTLERKTETMFQLPFTNTNDALSPFAVKVTDVKPAPFVGVTVTGPVGVADTVIILCCPSVPSDKTRATAVEPSIADNDVSAVISVVSVVVDTTTVCMLS